MHIISAIINVLVLNFLYIIIINTPKNNSMNTVTISPKTQTSLYNIKSEQTDKTIKMTINLTTLLINILLNSFFPTLINENKSISIYCSIQSNDIFK